MTHICVMSPAALWRGEDKVAAREIASARRSRRLGHHGCGCLKSLPVAERGRICGHKLEEKVVK